MYGSAGGDGSTPGGGVLHIEANKVVLDGNIEASGASGKKGSSTGGGSGGSILIESQFMEGTGSVLANGGDGGTNGGGGGSGGRIAIFFKQFDFTGTASVFGGDSSVEAGAAGTIYKEDISKKYKILVISNKGRKPLDSDIQSYTRLSADFARTWITSESMNPNPKRVPMDNLGLNAAIYEGFTVDELLLSGGSHMAIEPELHRGNFLLHTFKKVKGTFEGGSFGFVHTGPRQMVQIHHTNLYIPMNLKVYEGSYLKLPPRVMLHKNSLMLNGHLLGVNDLVISNCVVKFGKNAGATTNRKVKPLEFHFSSLTLLDAAYLDLRDTSNEYFLAIKNLVLHAGGTIEGRNITFIGQTFTIKEEGTVKLDGHGIRCKPYNSYNYGCGGSHAGYGGLGPHGLANRYRIQPFDSVYLPKLYGESGRAELGAANCAGGSGGGKLNISVTGTVHVDGTLTSR